MSDLERIACACTAPGGRGSCRAVSSRRGDTCVALFEGQHSHLQTAVDGVNAQTRPLTDQPLIRAQQKWTKLPKAGPAPEPPQSNAIRPIHKAQPPPQTTSTPAKGLSVPRQPAPDFASTQSSGRPRTANRRDDDDDAFPRAVLKILCPHSPEPQPPPAPPPPPPRPRATSAPPATQAAPPTTTTPTAQPKSPAACWISLSHDDHAN
jgi:hypothetical protein